MKITNEFKHYAEGLQFFVPEDEKAYAQGKPCKGFGSVKYNEGSVYYGDLYFDGTYYNKLGFGRQEFHYSDISGEFPIRKVRRNMYVGNFDYRQTDWIYGNGIMYFYGYDNKPNCFVKGFYSGTFKIGDWEGEFNPDVLIEGFTPDMEDEFDAYTDKLNYRHEQFAQSKGIENLFFGDSYFDLWDDPRRDIGFYEIFPKDKNLNIGIGGTKFHEWEPFVKRLAEIPAEQMPQPKRIFINLGFNDLHANLSAEKVVDNARSLLNGFKKYIPNAQYYILSVVKAPNFTRYYDEELKLNALLKEKQQELGFTQIEMRQPHLDQVNGSFDNIDPDGIHPNNLGYRVYETEIKKILES